MPSPPAPHSPPPPPPPRPPLPQEDETINPIMKAFWRRLLLSGGEVRPSYFPKCGPMTRSGILKAIRLVGSIWLGVLGHVRNGEPVCYTVTKMN